MCVHCDFKINNFIQNEKMEEQAPLSRTLELSAKKHVRKCRFNATKFKYCPASNSS
jgi:hypothetical protein